MTNRKKAKAKPVKKGPAGPPGRKGYGFERKIAKNLNDAKQPFEYESELLPYTVPEKKKRYKPDFIITSKRSKKKIYLEGKGKMDPKTREKMELVKKQHPDKDIRFIFERNNAIRKGSKTRYTDWADRVGYQYTISANGTIPESWLEE
jgi:hypothetical protein